MIDDERHKVAGIGADRWEVLRFSQLRTKLVDTATDTLTNTGLPFAPQRWSERSRKSDSNDIPS